MSRPSRSRSTSARLALVLGCAWGAGGAAASARAQETAALDLERAVLLARTRNERAQAAGERSAAAAARLARARAFFFPDLGISGSYTRRAYESVRTVEGERTTIQSRNALQGSALLSLALFDARSIPLYRQASRENRAARLQAEEDRRLVEFEAADAFLRALGAEQVLAAAEQRLDFARRSLQDARARFEAQLASSNDVTRTELEVATAERELAGARAGAQTAFLELGNLLDAPVAGPLAEPAAVLDSATVEPAGAEALVGAARPRRLDVAAGREHAEALHQFAQEPRLRYLPSLGFAGQARLTNERGFAGRDRDWSLGLNVSWALYDGGERGADRAERRALARAADLETRASERRVEFEVRAARVALENAQAALRSARVAEQAAHRNAEEVGELYRQGLARALEVADANVRRFEADVALARQRFGLGLAFLDLRAALGLDPLGKEPTP